MKDPFPFYNINLATVSALVCKTDRKDRLTNRPTNLFYCSSGNSFVFETGGPMLMQVGIQVSI